jgi:Fe(3+) dicitrate transport protein
MALLRGEVDSSERLVDTLDVTDNAREYGSQGLESELGYEFGAGSWQHQLALGLRYHHDYVDRDHQINGYWMQGGELVFDGVNDRAPKTDNRAETDALALFVSDEIRRGNWKFNLGLRAERIEGELHDRASNSRRANTQDVVMPGAGVFYQWTPELGLLVGINKGFSPSGPGAGDQVDPEESVNYEYGVRYQSGALTLDAIGFFSDYSNLLGRCRVSDAGCEPGEEFNGGSVEIAGLELTGGYQWLLGNHITVPLSLVYTYTESAFQTGFVSDFSQWGTVHRGDELPYTPDHQARFSAGLQGGDWDLELTLKYTGEMRDEPGRGEPDRPLEAHTTLDLSGTCYLSSDLSVKLVVENLTDEQEIVSRRPFGARPNAPRRVHLGVTYRF